MADGKMGQSQHDDTTARRIAVPALGGYPHGRIIA
jgi:hypothetical protein